MFSPQLSEQTRLALFPTSPTYDHWNNSSLFYFKRVCLKLSLQIHIYTRTLLLKQPACLCPISRVSLAVFPLQAPIVSSSSKVLLVEKLALHRWPHPHKLHTSQPSFLLFSCHFHPLRLPVSVFRGRPSLSLTEIHHFSLCKQD